MNKAERRAYVQRWLANPEFRATLHRYDRDQNDGDGEPHRVDSPYGLTSLQRDTLLVVQELSDAGTTPNYRELQEELDLSSHSQVHSVLTRLRSRGYIDWMPRQSRSLRVLLSIKPPEEAIFVGFFEDEGKVKEFNASTTGTTRCTGSTS